MNRRSPRTALWSVLAILAVTLVTRAAAADPLPDRSARLVATARVWAHAKFFHPYLAYKDIDWDAALIAAIPKIEAATTVQQYRAALQEMFGKLADPVTRVENARPKAAPATAPATASTAGWITTPVPGVVLVELAGFTAGGWDYLGFGAKGKQVTAELEKAKVAVIDLRVGDRTWLAQAALAWFEDALPAIEEWPLERWLEHRGYRSQEQTGSGGYYSSFVTTGAAPPKPAPKAGPAQVVFITDPRTGVPAAALALQAAGRARIVASGVLSDVGVVQTATISLGGGLDARLRIGESLWPVPAADVRAPDGELRARALALAKTLITARATPRPRKLLALPPARALNDLDYKEQLYPARPLRLLAGIRIWAVLEHFNPYRYLADDWDRVLGDTLPKLEAAADRDAYVDVLREMSARAGDGHIGISFATSPPPRGFAPFEPRLVEGKLVVTRLVDAGDAKQLGVAVGDVIEAIDGKPVAAALAALRPFVSGSTAEARDQRVAWRLLFGNDGTVVKLRVRGSDGRTRDIDVTRRGAHLAARAAPLATPHWKELAGNIGYVDLMQLAVSEVEPMFAALHKTRAIIFDMRGYPKGTAWSIAPRVNTRKAAYGAQFLRPLVSGEPDNDYPQLADNRHRTLQRIAPLPPGASVYTGKIIVLIDDRAISQSEHTCLFLQEAANATFIGSPTHGANGGVTHVRLPGGLRMTFTGQEVRHADGKQLQRVGIQPHMTVRPTIAGIRAGRDEVLERALVYLEKGK